MKKEIKVFAPASVTNVGSGFDVFGFALESPGDELVLRINEKAGGVEIKKITGDNGKLPLEAALNTAGKGLIALKEHLGLEKEIEITLHKKMALGSGLGSSAASAVASVFALNEILDRPLKKSELINFALEGEKLTSGGTPHADNVGASLYGGFILVRSMEPLDVISIDTPDKLVCTVIHPHLEIFTSETRKILKKEISLSLAVKQWGNTAGFVAGMLLKDYELIGRSLEDVIIEPTRSMLIPGFSDIKQAAIDTGALGCSISGSGPSLFALSTSQETAKKVGKAMQKVTGALDINSDLFISCINKAGPKVIG